MKLTASVMAAIVIATISGTAFLLASQREPAQKEPVPEQTSNAEYVIKKTIREEAESVYEQYVAATKVGGGGVGGGGSAEERYRWSKRLLAAELDVAQNTDVRRTSLRAHVDRMKKLEDVTAEWAKAGVSRPGEAAAGRYYRAQAELWLARGRVD